jgi:hypothetical protein
VAEIVLAAGVKTQILAHSRALHLQKADQAAEMVKMPVTEDQRIDRGGVDLQQVQVVLVHGWSEAEIQQIISGLAALVRLDVQCEPPFAAQGPSLRRE